MFPIVKCHSQCRYLLIVRGTNDMHIVSVIYLCEDGDRDKQLNEWISYYEIEQFYKQDNAPFAENINIWPVGTAVLLDSGFTVRTPRAKTKVVEWELFP